MIWHHLMGRIRRQAEARQLEIPIFKKVIKKKKLCQGAKRQDRIALKDTKPVKLGIGDRNSFSIWMHVIVRNWINLKPIYKNLAQCTA